jgi:hypothetical protein
MTHITSEMVGRQVLARTERSGTGCALFTGHLNANGYGVVRLAGKTTLAHRAVWAAANGPIPVGMEVCHACDVRACVELSHLFLGTREENQQDMYRKGRGRKASGERHGRAKLTAADVIRMRELHATGISYRDIAQQFGVGKSTAADAVRGAHWKGLEA